MISHRKRQAGNNDSDDPEISASGAVVFESDASNLARDTNGFDDIYLWRGGKLKKLSKAWNGRQAKGGVDGSEKPDITPDGKWVTFHSDATNLIKKGTPAGTDQVYRVRVSDLKRKLVSKNFAKVGNDHSEDSHISNSGAFIVFETRADNITPGGDSNGHNRTVLRRGPY